MFNFYLLALHYKSEEMTHDCTRSNDDQLDHSYP